jgi:hypothetical protein
MYDSRPHKKDTLRRRTLVAPSFAAKARDGCTAILSGTCTVRDPKVSTFVRVNSGDDDQSDLSVGRFRGSGAPA